MDTERSGTRARAKALYLVGMASLVGVAASIGVFGRGDLTTETVESVRGETYEVITTGIYAWNGDRLVGEGVGWDIVTLFLVVPALVIAARWVHRGSMRGRLFALGLLAYVFYQYLMYAMAWAVGPMLLPFIGLYAAALVGIAWFGASIPLRSLPALVGTRYPRRSMVAFSTAIALLLAGMWVPMIAQVVGGELDEVLHGQTTLVVQALDLGLLVPLAVATAVLMVRRAPLGYLFATALAVKGAAMGVAICAMVVVGWRVEGDLDVGGLVIFAVVAAACMALTVAMFRALAEPTETSGEPIDADDVVAQPAPGGSGRAT